MPTTIAHTATIPAPAAQIRRVRRLARKQGYLINKLPDLHAPYDTVQVVECSSAGGGCKAGRFEMEHGHWRAHHDVFSGTLGDVEGFLNSRSVADPDQASWAHLPEIDADNASAGQGYVDEYISRMAPAIRTDDYEDPRPITVELIRSANNQPGFGVPLLDYRVNLLIGERTNQGFDEVVSFYEIDRVEQLARQILDACAVARADLGANSAFVEGRQVNE